MSVTLNSNYSGVAAPRVYIDAYPFEGGKIEIKGQNVGIRNVTTSKSIRGGGGGTFQLDLEPGGPGGVNSRPTWMDIFTPMTLVVIGMERAPFRQITMIGLVQSTQETMQRNQQGVGRAVTVVGADFTLMFTAFCYYNLNFQIGVDKGTLGSLGLLSTINDSLFGTPDEVAKSWYLKIMAGPGSIMESTSFAYKTDRVTLFQIMATWFEAYPGSVQIPTMAGFLGDEGTWLNKFQSFLPYPWYEFFIQTAPAGWYEKATAATTPIEMTGFLASSPVVIGRVNPFPQLVASGDSGKPTFSVDLSAWQDLPVFHLAQGVGPLSTDFTYSEDEVKNYFIYMPTFLGTGAAASNGNISPFQLLFAAWYDVNSNHRYGFRPQVSEVRWMADPTGAWAKQFAAQGKTQDDMQSLVSQLSLRVVSYYEPTPNMLKGSIKIPLRPDILPGCIFSCVPYRDGVEWLFYIDAISHSVPMGGMATTTISVSRGLTAANYANKDMMVALLTGNAMRVNGSLQIGSIASLGPTLQPLNTETLAAALGATSKLFALPSGNHPP